MDIPAMLEEERKEKGRQKLWGIWTMLLFVIRQHLRQQLKTVYAGKLFKRCIKIDFSFRNR